MMYTMTIELSDEQRQQLRGALAEALDPKPCAIHVYRLQKERHEFRRTVVILSGPSQYKPAGGKSDYLGATVHEEGTCIRCGAKRPGDDNEEERTR